MRHASDTAPKSRCSYAGTLTRGRIEAKKPLWSTTTLPTVVQRQVAALTVSDDTVGEVLRPSNTELRVDDDDSDPLARSTDRLRVAISSLLRGSSGRLSPCSYC